MFKDTSEWKCTKNKIKYPHLIESIKVILYYTSTQLCTLDKAKKGMRKFRIYLERKRQRGKVACKMTVELLPPAYFLYLN